MASKFLTVLSVTPLNDGSNWKLNQDFCYISETCKRVITVPRNFITDFASVPRELWNVYPPWDKYGPAAIVHDWLYWDKPVTRDLADLTLREAMKTLGCDSVTIEAIYRAVALFGSNAWNGDAKRKQAGYTRMAKEANPDTYPFATDPWYESSNNDPSNKLS